MTTDREEILKCIDAEEIILGENVKFGDNVRIAAIGGRANRIEIGDNVFIGNNVLILVPDFSVGDFTNIHQSCRISGYKRLTIGHNSWVDQNNILNSSERLKIGNNVGIGSYCQLWTHIRWGDTVIGCKFDEDRPMTIHDDVYFGGLCIVSPVVIEAKCFIMGGSTVTKNLEKNHIYGGNPAIDITHKLGAPYNEIPVSERLVEMDKRVADFFEKNEKWRPGSIKVIDSWDGEIKSDVTYFNVADRTYSKRRNPIEVDIMRHLLPTAKFLPRIVES
jgi:acetyltransferase-like isoleucine patch superfamily enzyme